MPKKKSQTALGPANPASKQTTYFYTYHYADHKCKKRSDKKNIRNVKHVTKI